MVWRVEVIQYWILRLFLYMEGVFPFRFYYKLKQLRDVDLIRKEGSGLHFRQATLLEYFHSLPPDDPQRMTARFAHPLFRRIFLAAILGFGLVLLSWPFANRYIWKGFWTGPDEIHFSVGASPVRQIGKVKFIATATAKLRLTINGLINVGTYTGYIGPEGTRIGFLGFPLGSVYNPVPSERHGALLYQKSNAAGRSAWSHLDYEKKQYFIYSRNRSALIAVNAGDTLAFRINDKEWENNSGHFTVMMNKCDTCK